MNRYEVSVLVTYKITADSVDDAYEKIEKGAEFPVMPFDDETYCDKVQIMQVIDLAELNEEQDSYEYFCQYCSEFTNTEFACPHCNEYKGLIKVSEHPEIVEK